MLLAGVVLLVTLPLAVLVAPSVAIGLLGRDTAPPSLARNRSAAWLAAVCQICVVAVTTAVPLTGILAPLFSEFPLTRAFAEIVRTAKDTLVYAAVAGLIATAMGIVPGVAIGRGRRLRTVSLALLFLIISLPPSLSALGLIKFGASMPQWLDPLLRSRLTVGLALAMRFLPIAAILAMRAFGSMSPSRCHVAAVHGLSLPLYVRRILAPQMVPAAAIACVVVALAATADIGTVVLLRPPGADCIPVQIFTVIANAPEPLVAALCFFYVATVAILLISGWCVTGWARKT
jgi:iron(III) transport system permease protein